MQTDSDEEEDRENIGNPVEYLGLVRKALFQTRKILEEHDADGHIIQQMGKVFQIYGGKNHMSSVNPDSSYSQLSELSIESGARLLEDDSKTLELTSLPRFIRFFRVSHADEIFFEQTIERLSYLTEDPKYVDNGVSFKVLLHELNQCDFMIGC